MSTPQSLPQNEENATFSTCPVCGHAVRPFDVRCNQCGATLALDTTPVASLVEPLAAARLAVGYCPHCDVKLAHSSKWQKFYNKRLGWTKLEQCDCPSCWSTFYPGPRVELAEDEIPQIGRK